MKKIILSGVSRGRAGVLWWSLELSGSLKYSIRKIFKSAFKKQKSHWGGKALDRIWKIWYNFFMVTNSTWFAAYSAKSLNSPGRKDLAGEKDVANRLQVLLEPVFFCAIKKTYHFFTFCKRAVYYVLKNSWPNDWRIKKTLDSEFGNLVIFWGGIMRQKKIYELIFNLETAQKELLGANQPERAGGIKFAIGEIRKKVIEEVMEKEQWAMERFKTSKG